jgi:hypothetical protein
MGDMHLRQMEYAVTETITASYIAGTQLFLFDFIRVRQRSEKVLRNVARPKARQPAFGTETGQAGHTVLTRHARFRL